MLGLISHGGGAMKFLETAFGQLAFAWKLYNYGLDGKINREDLDIPLTFKEDGMMLVLPDRVLDSDDDLRIALANNLGIAFGAAAITLNRSREEAGLTLPNPIATDTDQFVALTYQIRNAFAHDISEPRWNITQARYRRAYAFDGVNVDLTDKHERFFDYEDIGGPETLFQLHQFGKRLWA